MNIADIGCRLRFIHLIKRSVQKNGLVPISAHVSYAGLRKDPHLFDPYVEIGCRYAIMPYLAEEYRPGTEGFNVFNEESKKLGTLANCLGIKLGYHNHRFDFEKIDGECGWDKLYIRILDSIISVERNSLDSKGGILWDTALAAFGQKSGQMYFLFNDRVSPLQGYVNNDIIR